MMTEIMIHQKFFLSWVYGIRHPKRKILNSDRFTHVLKTHHRRKAKAMYGVQYRWRYREKEKRDILWQKHVAIATVSTYILQGLFVLFIMKHRMDGMETISDTNTKAHLPHSYTHLEMTPNTRIYVFLYTYKYTHIYIDMNE